MDAPINQRNLEKAASLGEPSYVWRAGQERRLQKIIAAAGDCLHGRVLDNGCGVGIYSKRLIDYAQQVISLEYDLARSLQAHQQTPLICNASSEKLPFAENYFDLILSHEVLEHIHDDKQAVREMLRVLRFGGRIILFVPNRCYPFETHGFFWRGKYYFGNIPLINYLPSLLRKRLAPHVRVYSRKDIKNLFNGFTVKFIHQQTIFGGYDNIISHRPALGKFIRSTLQRLENSPFQLFGLSHFWVIEKNQ